MGDVWMGEPLMEVAQSHPKLREKIQKSHRAMEELNLLTYNIVHEFFLQYL